MNKIIDYLKENWIVTTLGALILLGFFYYSSVGNSFCDCAKTETYRDGTTRSHSSGRSFYRYYHK